MHFYFVMDTFEYLLKCASWVEFVPVNAKKAYKGRRGIAPLISTYLALALRGGVVSFTPRPLYFRESTQVPTE